MERGGAYVSYPTRRRAHEEVQREHGSKRPSHRNRKGSVSTMDAKMTDTTNYKDLTKEQLVALAKWCEAQRDAYRDALNMVLSAGYTSEDQNHIIKWDASQFPTPEVKDD